MDHNTLVNIPAGCSRADTALTVKNLNVSFPVRNSNSRAYAVKNICFEVGRGKTLCLVGESGSGKSMTARAIMQLVPHPGRVEAEQMTLSVNETSEVHIDRLPPFSKSMRELRGSHIGMIFQEPMSSLGPVHRIGSQIIEAIRAHEAVSKKEARSRAIELLRQVEIQDPEHAVDRYPFEYSGGMRQRAMIAIALACSPRLLIADEPTTALDVTTQAEILELLKRLQKENGMSLLFITHDMGVVAEIADTVAVMHEGIIREIKSVHDIFANPEDDYTRLLMNTAKLLEGQGDGIRGADSTPPVEEKEKPSTAESSILTVRDLTVTFGGTKQWFGPAVPEVKAVDNVSLELRRGESLGIVGESGSGKTTLARTIMRVVRPSSGEIFYKTPDGNEVDLALLTDKEFKSRLTDIRMIFQDPFASLNPRMTIGDTIAEPLKIEGRLTTVEIKDRVDELLRSVELPVSVKSRYPHAFSGGQRQRISIARALATYPKLVIADEATAALDVSLRSQVLDLLARIQKQMNLSIIFIGHDIGVVRYFCDRIGVMYQGKLVEIGTSSQVCLEPRHDYTKSLLSAIPRPDPTLRGQLGRTRYRPTSEESA